MIWVTSSRGQALGALERQVMECLWAAPQGLNAGAVRAQVSTGELALTTVHTLLTRLEQKGFVEHDQGRPRRFRPTATEADHVAAVMSDLLQQAEDRDAVLARFVGSVSSGEASLLRRLLLGRRDGSGTPPAVG